MTTQYPAQIDNAQSLPSVTGGITSFNPTSVNQLRNAIIAIETELGVKPSGLYSTVRMRLDALEATLEHIIAGESGSVNVIGIPQIGNAIIWSGTAWIPSNNFVNQSLTLSGKIAVGAEAITPPVSSSNQGVIYFDSSQHRFLVSENGGAYEPLGAANIIFANDLSGSFLSQTVVGIRNIPVNLGTLTAGIPLIYDGTEWTAAVNEAVTTGPLLSTSLTTSLMTLNGKAVLNAITPPVSVSSPGQGIIYFDSTNNEFMVSENGDNYFPIVLNGDNQAFSTTGAVTTGPLLSTSETTGLLTLTGAFVANGITAPAVSDAGQGIMYYDSTANEFMVSENGALYFPIVLNGDGEAVSFGPVLATSTTTSLFTLNGKFITNAITGPVAVSDPGQGIIYFDSSQNQYLVSQNGGAYVPLVDDNIDNVTPITGSYPVVASDRVIAVGTLAGPITVTLPASPTTGQTFTIKDVNASAAVHNITVSGNGHNIDGLSSQTISTNYGVITVAYTGTQWSIR